MPLVKKTIKPTRLGGIAGGDTKKQRQQLTLIGEKYICHGILFKFALDIAGIYGGDQFAMKAAGHELKVWPFCGLCANQFQGLMCFYNCQIPALHVPFMALIDYRGTDICDKVWCCTGFRVVAMSVLPVDKTTIIYGSNDGGQTVFASNPKFNALMKIVRISPFALVIISTGWPPVKS